MFFKLESELVFKILRPAPEFELLSIQSLELTQK